MYGGLISVGFLNLEKEILNKRAHTMFITAEARRVQAVT